MRRAAAIVTDHGGRTSHAAIVSRELGLPAIVGTGNATQLLHDEQEVTVSCAEGEQGFVYEGFADFEAKELDLTGIPKTRTQVMLNLANPAAAFRWWRIPADGVGLARMEFVVSNHIKIHPMALVRYDTLADESAKSQIAELTAGLPTKDRIFRRSSRPRLGAGSPPPIIQAGHRAHERLQDQRICQSDRRRRVRAEGRKPDARVPRRLALLLAALPRGLRARMPRNRRLREEMGFRNVIVMIPFCRSTKEADRCWRSWRRTA